jgi:hypothetical protein
MLTTPPHHLHSPPRLLRLLRCNTKFVRDLLNRSAMTCTLRVNRISVAWGGGNPV